jgi:hypothetical protein
MNRAFLVLSLLAAVCWRAASAADRTDWKTVLAERLPALGHRNWILVVDSAYPWQVSPGIEMIETGADQATVVRYVLKAIADSFHVHPEIFMDAELPFVSDQDAPGASAYRAEIGEILRPYKIQSELHDQLIAQIGEDGREFHVLVLKTNLTIPYSSVFIRLDCKYWPADAEQRLRAKMGAAK